MGAIVGALVSLAGKQVVNAASGQVEKSVSKTKIAAAGLLAVGPDWGDLIGRALQKDPEAIGKIVLLVATYALTLWGRGNEA